jgi:hypothetical protein
MLINFYEQFCNLRNMSKSMISLPRVPLFELYAYLLNITVIMLLYATMDLIRVHAKYMRQNSKSWFPAS